ncbi:GNAT family N-acetyltransferase [Ruegeria sp. PrR005]|uniref:GNAT family N-acetyltransferase n=1 Tax=Ruegeria sp. PrR005 TaxID=2706882 RepID=A0A6B2NP64_9RHOB|nr:GNAT family N-acetyltransferase [Ruegeria sp. PrR005]NDW45168.1 GNAT family N-acetyltransferase [Ruegeria sp. PrR005]
MTPADLAHAHARAFDQSRPWTESEFADLLNSDHVQVIGTTDCFAVFQVVTDETEMLTIATNPQLRRQGLARDRIQIWLSMAIRQGAIRALLEVAADNSAAIALYDRCGFTPCGRRKGYYRRPDGEMVDAIMMERALP